MSCVDLGYVGSETLLRSMSMMSLLGLVLKVDFFTDSLEGLTIDRPRLGLRRDHSMSSRSLIRLLNASTLLRLPRARLPMICTVGFVRKVWHAPVCWW
jgi:hypothetical protein